MQCAVQYSADWSWQLRSGGPDCYFLKSFFIMKCRMPLEIMKEGNAGKVKCGGSSVKGQV